MDKQPPAVNSQEKDFRDTALRILDGREHSCAELNKKLRQRGCSAVQAEQLVAKMLQLGLLDDLRFAGCFVREGLRKNWGAGRIKRELVQRGVDRDIIAAAAVENGLDDQESEFTRAETILRRKFRSGADRQKMVRFLAARGYSSACAFAAVKKVTSEFAETPDSDYFCEDF